jgi:hypothetical protein
MEGQKENSLLIYIFFNKLKGNFKMLGAALPISITSLSQTFWKFVIIVKIKK